MGGARVRSSIGEEIATFRRSGLSEAWFEVNLDLSSPSRKAGRRASPAIHESRVDQARNHQCARSHGPALPARPRR